MEETEMHIVSKRSQFEKVTNFMIPTIWHSEKGKTWDSKKITDVADGDSKTGMNGWSTEDL